MCLVVLENVHVVLNHVGDVWVVFVLHLLHPKKCNVSQRVKKISVRKYIYDSNLKFSSATQSRRINLMRFSVCPLSC